MPSPDSFRRIPDKGCTVPEIVRKDLREAFRLPGVNSGLQRKAAKSNYRTEMGRELGDHEKESARVSRAGELYVHALV